MQTHCPRPRAESLRRRPVCSQGHAHTALPGRPSSCSRQPAQELGSLFSPAHQRCPCPPDSSAPFSLGLALSPALPSCPWVLVASVVRWTRGWVSVAPARVPAPGASQGSHRNKTSRREAARERLLSPMAWLEAVQPKTGVAGSRGCSCPGQLLPRCISVLGQASQVPGHPLRATVVPGECCLLLGRGHVPGSQWSHWGLPGLVHPSSGGAASCRGGGQLSRLRDAENTGPHSTRAVWHFPNHCQGSRRAWKEAGRPSVASSLPLSVTASSSSPHTAHAPGASHLHLFLGRLAAPCSLPAGSLLCPEAAVLKASASARWGARGTPRSHCSSGKPAPAQGPRPSPPQARPWAPWAPIPTPRLSAAARPGEP